jgi:diadenosine tetraphosphate (Ap4A) HIT family hydrolase
MRRDEGFVLDPRLEADSHFIANGPVSQLRLVDDGRYDWLALVPRVPDAVEWFDLDRGRQAVLLDEVRAVAAALRAGAACEKINIGALGNIVRQLHVHVVARNTGDPAWPGPVWGASALRRRSDAERAAAIERWSRALATFSST